MNIHAFLKRYFRLLDEEALAQDRGIDVYNRLVKFLRSFLRFVGWDVLQKPFIWNWRTKISVMGMVTYILCMFYTSYVHWGDWLELIDTLSVAGMGISTLTKLIVSHHSVEYFQENYRQLTALYTRNVGHKANNRVLVFCGTMIFYAYKFFLVIFLLAAFGYMVAPVYMYFFHNEATLAMNLHIPGINPTTYYGYILTTALHIFLLTMGLSGILASDLGIMTIILHIIGIADVFKNTLNELDHLLEKSKKREKCDEVNRKLLEICVMHQEIIMYEEDLDSAYGTLVFVQVIGSVSCIALSLFTFYMTLRVSSLTFLVAAFFQLLQFCVIGTTLTVKNNDIMLALYDTFWFKLSSEEQKMWGLMLHRSQNAVEMTVGGLALLNMETFVEIMKTIYSYSAMLVQFLE